MFTTACFVRKNTPELRKKLEELGYKFSGADHIELDCIVTLPHHNTFSVFAAYHFNIYDNSFKTVWKEYIDCGTNEELFLALAALRDDTCKNQWLTDGKIWGKFDEDSFLHPIQIINYLQSKGHKASIEEIIEHFKDK